MVPHERWANSSFNQPQLVVYGCYHGFSWEMGPTQVSINHNWLFMDVTMVPHERLDNYLKFQSTTTGCFWMLPWFLVRDVPTQVSILHNWFMDVTMVPNERWANSTFNPPQLVVYGCFHGSSWEMGQLKCQSTTTGCLWMLPWFLIRDGPTQVSIIHNWLFMDVTMVPHERWANSSFNHPQLVVFGCYHSSS